MTTIAPGGDATDRFRCCVPKEITVSALSSRAVQRLAHAVYLNSARDADFPRRDRSRAALDALRRARSVEERVAANRLVMRAAHDYGLRPRATPP